MHVLKRIKAFITLNLINFLFKIKIKLIFTKHRHSIKSLKRQAKRFAPLSTDLHAITIKQEISALCDQLFFLVRNHTTPLHLFTPKRYLFIFIKQSIGGKFSLDRKSVV